MIATDRSAPACYSLIGSLNAKAKSNILSLKSIGHGPLLRILAAFVAIYFMTTEQLQARPTSRNQLQKKKWLRTFVREGVAQRKVVISRTAYSHTLSIIVKMEISIMGSEMGDKQHKIEKSTQ